MCLICGLPMTLTEPLVFIESNRDGVSDFRNRKR